MRSCCKGYKIIFVFEVYGTEGLNTITILRPIPLKTHNSFKKSLPKPVCVLERPNVQYHGHKTPIRHVFMAPKVVNGLVVVDIH